MRSSSFSTTTFYANTDTCSTTYCATNDYDSYYACTTCDDYLSVELEKYLKSKNWPKAPFKILPTIVNNINKIFFPLKFSKNSWTGKNYKRA